MKPTELFRTHGLALGFVIPAAALLSLMAPREAAIVHAAPQLGLLGGIRATNGPAQVAQNTSPHGPFHVRSYVGRCLTYGGGKPLVASTGASSPASTGTRPPSVYLDDCNGQERIVQSITALTRLQQVVVQEINGQHHVVLRAGGKVLGVMGGFLINHAPLELQDLNYTAEQVFALDGDSIVLVADRELVVTVQNGRGATGTPLVLGTRELADAEFWSFETTDGSDQRPTSGFVRVPQDWGLEQALLSAGPGTVIDVDPSYTLSLNGRPTLFIPGGVTIRGNRRGGALMGPEVSKTTYDVSPMFEVNGDDVRITGMRMRGPSSTTDQNPEVDGILVHDRFARVIVDHNDMSSWTGGAVGVGGDDHDDWQCHVLPDVRPHNARVVRNFLHDNKTDGEGYGVGVGAGAYPLISGNTFLRNRHAIAGGGAATDGYAAFFNLVQADAPSYSWGTHEQDFDMHGSDASGHHTGGIGGASVEIARNTFLGTDRRNFDLRGVSCGLDQFHDNISLQNKGDAIRWYVTSWNPPGSIAAQICPWELKARVEHNNMCGFQQSPDSPAPYWLQIPDDGHRFGRKPNPVDTLRVGDFDGDGKDDLFLATGAAWYYAPSGQAEWRFLSGHTELPDQLLFGDFDGDGRTDVFTKSGRDWLVSWGGMTDWEKINESDGALADMAIGDFNGDHRADVFYANGYEWAVSFGGVGPLTHYAYLRDRVPNLKFGNFDGNGRTDVLSVFGGNWMVVRGGTDFWSFLRPAPMSTVNGLMVADFGGNGRDDIALIDNGVLRLFRGGVGDPVSVNSGLQADHLAGIGRFDDQKGADLLFWQDAVLSVSSSGAGALQRLSRQTMK